jgi:hypothetical protein
MKVFIVFSRTPWEGYRDVIFFSLVDGAHGAEVTAAL